MADPSYGSLSYRPHGPLIWLMIECSDTLNGSESILGKKFSKSNFLTLSLERALHIKYLSFCLSDDALFLFSKTGYLLLCVESLPLTTTLSPVVSPTSLAYPRMAILLLLPNFVSVWWGTQGHMRECLEFCWGWREVRGKDWRLGVMGHWSHLYGNHLVYFYPWHTPASEPRLVSMANWCGGPKQLSRWKI